MALPAARAVNLLCRRTFAAPSFRFRHCLRPAGIVQSRLPHFPTRTQCTNSGSASFDVEEFAAKIETQLRESAKDLETGAANIDKIVSLVRLALSQAKSGDPNENFDINDRLDELDPAAVNILGVFLVQVRFKPGFRESLLSVSPPCWILVYPTTHIVDALTLKLGKTEERKKLWRWIRFWR